MAVIDRLVVWSAGLVFEGFAEEMVAADGVKLYVRHGGTGPVTLLLHGHPRTSATWHRVAPLLVARGLTVVCADLPGYGRSGKPTPTADHSPHSKRAGARHLVAGMRALGHDRFAVVGHDRGSYYALRLALDHPQAVRRVALLACLPISEHLDRADRRFATAWWPALRAAERGLRPGLPLSTRIERVLLIAGAQAADSWRIVHELPLRTERTANA